MIKLTYKELADWFGDSEGAVRMRLNRADLSLAQDQWRGVLDYLVVQKQRELLDRIKSGLDKLKDES